MSVLLLHVIYHLNLQVLHLQLKLVKLIQKSNYKKSIYIYKFINRNLIMKIYSLLQEQLQK